MLPKELLDKITEEVERKYDVKITFNVTTDAVVVTLIGAKKGTSIALNLQSAKMDQDEFANKILNKAEELHNENKVSDS